MTKVVKGNIDNIRRSLLWDKLRTLNSKISVEDYNFLTGLTVEKWCDTMFYILDMAYDHEDLRIVHGMLYPQKEI